MLKLKRGYNEPCTYDTIINESIFISYLEHNLTVTVLRCFKHEYFYFESHFLRPQNASFTKKKYRECYPYLDISDGFNIQSY